MPSNKNNIFDKPIISPEEHKKRNEKVEDFFRKRLRKRILVNLKNKGITDVVFLKPKDD